MASAIFFHLKDCSCVREGLDSEASSLPSRTSLDLFRIPPARSLDGRGLVQEFVTVVSPAPPQMNLTSSCTRSRVDRVEEIQVCQAPQPSDPLDLFLQSSTLIPFFYHTSPSQSLQLPQSPLTSHANSIARSLPVHHLPLQYSSLVSG